MRRLTARTRYLLLAVAAAVLAGTFAYVYLSGLGRREPVVVAARDFPGYSALDAGMVKTVLVPSAAVHPSSLAQEGEAIGLISLVPRVAGEPILASSLVSGQNPGEYRAALDPEERAFFLPSDTVVGGWRGVAAGDFVDLTAVLDETSYCLGQGLEVLEVVTGEGLSPLVGGRAEAPAGVFLRLSPALAVEVALVAEAGRVYYAVDGYNAVPVPAPRASLEALGRQEAYTGGE